MSLWPVWRIDVFDKNWHLISRDYDRISDRQAAELKAEMIMDDMGGSHFELTKIR